MRENESGGIGAGAYEGMRTRGMRPVVTDLASIDAAVKSFIEGKIVDRVDKLH
jgi:predicted Fe-Mo cluster-binding NifX family protein